MTAEMITDLEETAAAETTAETITGTEATAAQVAHQPVQHRDEGHAEQQPQQHISGKNNHGNLLINTISNTKKRSIRIRAARAYFSKSSWYTGKLSTLMRLVSILPISA